MNPTFEQWVKELGMDIDSIPQVVLDGLLRAYLG